MHDSGAQGAQVGFTFEPLALHPSMGSCWIRLLIPCKLFAGCTRGGLAVASAASRPLESGRRASAGPAQPLGGLGWGMSRAAAALLGAGTAAAYAGSSLSRCARCDGSDIENRTEDMEAMQAQAIHDDMVATGVLPEGEELGPSNEQLRCAAAEFCG
jgi:hypothetical protein